MRWKKAGNSFEFDNDAFNYHVRNILSQDEAVFILHSHGYLS